MTKYTKEIVPELEENVRNFSYENEDLKKKLNELSMINKDSQEMLTRMKIISQ